MRPDPDEVADGVSSGSRWRTPVVAVCGVSIVAAFVISGLQEHQLGDDPAAMIAVGLLLALVSGASTRGHPFRLGLAAMAGFPVWAVVDLALNGGHGLLPLELVFYAVYGVFGGIAATMAGWLRRRIR